jgi:Sec-independent protein secretion pathway component TatC
MVTLNDRYPEDYFAPSQMPLGDHLDELSKRLRRALAGIVIVMFLGFAVDMIGMSTGYTELGFAFPILRTMTEPESWRMWTPSNWPGSRNWANSAAGFGVR